jgi:hypothetical protein
LNVLGLISSPDGFDSLDVEEEKRKLGEALEKLVREGMVNLEWLEGGSLKELDGFINRNQGIHVFHFIGHGGYDTGDQRGILVLEGDRGEPQEVSGEELGLLFQDERGLKLAVLNSCEGARNSHIDPFSGAAASLVNFGVPAVIGMQFEITDQAAIAFSASLYEALARNMPVDAALAQARRSIFAAGNDIEFGTPVLFLRGRDARLFDVIDAPVPSPPSEAAGDDYGDEPKTQSGAEAERAPTYQAWIPRPWQERWGSLKADGFRVLGRIPTRLLAIGSVLLIVGGTVVTTAFGHENADGGHESILGAILVWLGTLGLLAALVKIAYSSLRARIRRLRDWWTGNG